VVLHPQALAAPTAAMTPAITVRFDLPHSGFDLVKREAMIPVRSWARLRHEECSILGAWIQASIQVSSQVLRQESIQAPSRA
jgi:hypothetical protein